MTESYYLSPCRSLPDLELVKESSIKSILRWNYKANMDKLMTSDNAQVALVHSLLSLWNAVSLFSSVCHDILNIDLRTSINICDYALLTKPKLPVIWKNPLFGQYICILNNSSDICLMFGINRRADVKWHSSLSWLVQMISGTAIT